MAGFHDHIEMIRKEFDIEGDADITDKNFEDIATITSVLKLFFRQLPVPLVTFEVYPKLTATGMAFKPVVATRYEMVISLRPSDFLSKSFWLLDFFCITTYVNPYEISYMYL